jgi:hypothetical protein
VNLVDRVAQSRTPLLVKDRDGGAISRLSNTADCAAAAAGCPLRYVLTDDLVGLCADLAYSKGARSAACPDLIRIPAQRFWIEWSNAPWTGALRRYGFSLAGGACEWIGRRGALVFASRDGRRGVVRTFWSGAREEDVLASSVEAFFDLDTPGDEEPDPIGLEPSKVYDEARGGADILARCFRFRYEPTWSEYYRRADLRDAERLALWRRNLGTIAMDIPMLLAFLLLLSTRSGLPQRLEDRSRVNRARLHAGKPPLLEHIEVRAPLLPEYVGYPQGEAQGTRRSPRLHHVRGHLVRHGSELLWRVPHLRGRAAAGVVRSRTVVWAFDDGRRPGAAP